MPDLLIELFSEEIPAAMQAKAAEDLRARMTEGLVEAGLTYASAAAFATPRRLALTIEGLSAESPDTVEERKGPKVGAPEKAIEGFLRGAGVARADLEERDTPKGAVYFAVIKTPGRPAPQIIAEVLESTIRNFPWPKSMRWGAGSLRWVRPLHSILCLLTDETGAQVVPLEIEGITAGDTTYGHRFMAPERIAVSGFDDYEAKLKRAYVILRPQERADLIWSDAKNLAFAQGMELVEDQGLLAEVAGLVEWPVVLMGQIDAAFLGLPPEVLILSMKEHQKFFSLRAPKTGRVERFITVANIDTADGGATILAGNQKVLAARLADAKFFWDNDLRVAKDGMKPWIAALEQVTFQSTLGSEKDRVERIAALAQDIAPKVGANPGIAAQAAQIAKADLCSEMVYEFPDLQGKMGRYYAAEAGFSAAISAAVQEHYAPLGPSDDVPTAPTSVALALADKLDKLTGFWSIDQKPTGSKDPYALRRAALGVIRLVLANDLRLPLVAQFDAQLLRHDIAQRDIAAEAQSALAELQAEIAKHGMFGAAARAIAARLAPAETKALDQISAASGDLARFFHDRLKVHLKSEGLRHDAIDACIAMPGNDDLTLLVKRAHALQAFLDTDDGENLLQGFKRANNILTQAEAQDGVEYSYGADEKFAETPAEKALFAALAGAEPQIAAALKSEDFAAAMGALAGLRAPIDGFFDTVQVNADNQVLRRNRLNLLSRIRTLCLGAADLTQLEG